MFGALTVASTPTIALQNLLPHKTLNLQNILSKTNDGFPNSISVSEDNYHQFYFFVTLSNSDYNGFSGFLDQIVFKLSDYNYHAWPLYFFQWLDDDDFHSGPMPALNSHTAHGFFHYPFAWSNRLEEHMGHFGCIWDDKSDTAYHMSINYGLWGTFGQNVDNQYKAAVAAHKAVGIYLNFAFFFEGGYGPYYTYPPSFKILT